MQQSGTGADPSSFGYRPHVVKNVAVEGHKLKPHVLEHAAATHKPNLHILNKAADTNKPKPIPEAPAVLLHKVKAPSGPPTSHGRWLQQESQPAEDKAEEAPDVPAGFQEPPQAGAKSPAGAQSQAAQSPAAAKPQAAAQSPAGAQSGAKLPAGAHPPGDKPTEDQQWCVAAPEATDDVLNYNIDYCCRMGVDCRPIQPGGACYNNNNLRSRASYVMNEYFNNNGHRSFNCFFSKSGIITPTDPSKYYLQFW